MSSSICPRCGGKEFSQNEQQTYHDVEELKEEYYTYKKEWRCLKCGFEFPSP